MTITIYGRPECGQCEQTKKQMERIGVSYNEINVDDDAEALKLVEASASRLQPASMLPMVVVKHDGPHGKGVTTWHGFRYDQIKGLTKNS